MFERNPIFTDRADAGRRLAERLKARSYDAPIVLALPRGGVPVGFEIAKALAAPLDVLLVRKIGAPGHEEFALGAVVEGDRPIVVVNEQMPADYAAYVEREAARQIEEIARRRTLYRGGRPLVRIAGRTVIVVDDGVATGATFRAALKALRRMHAEKVVAAIPVAPAESLAAIVAQADEVECLATPENFHAVGQYYGVFDQTSDEEVVRLLAPFR
jgi:putative phosphoribosyl transferase